MSKISKATVALTALAALATPSLGAAQSWAEQAVWTQAGPSSAYVEDIGYRHRGYAARRSYGRQRCYDRGNGGLAIGGIAGALAGRAIAGRGDRTLGTVLGAGVGALAGRAIDRSDGAPCYR